ncbi:GPI mannosyltransferase 3 [Nematocida major]|uniref:GPI mannosyltransferase 3 n=1 Tax=Nematocida major TaxID=1912982 RepID=UPI002007A470|nr:GPI mannosyltransferase 3 [Nematocida major]KAH9387472.1 GPI mannosyltransferase 3 [Nematocida major]
MPRRLSRSSLLFPSLVGFRLVNSLLLKTHFEPDEYFQSVEVAMAVILGKKVFTWEWFFGVRSFVFVSVFLLPLKGFHLLSEWAERFLRIYSAEPSRTEGLLFMAGAPYVVKAVTAVIAAVGDYSTVEAYKLLFKIGPQEVPREAVLATTLNLGLWLYSTRSHVNSFECAVTVHILHRLLKSAQVRDKAEKRTFHFVTVLMTAVMAYIRPTSVVNSACAWGYALSQEISSFNRAWMTKEKISEKNNGNFFRYFFRYLAVYVRHSRIISLYNLASAGIALFSCILIDSAFYREPVCSLFEFYRVNMMHKVSHFFGVLPFVFAPMFLCVLLGAYAAMLLACEIRWSSVEFVSPALYLAVHGIIAHKEMRFLLPILPCLNIIVARNLKSAFSAGDSPKKAAEKTFWRTASRSLKGLLFSKYVFIGNLAVGILVGIDHQNISRPLEYLRRDCTARLKARNEPVFILSAFNPYMLPMNTYLGHRRIVTRTVDNNPNILELAKGLEKKRRFQGKEYRLRLLEYDTIQENLVENIMLFGPLDYHYIVLDSRYGTELEQRLPEFIKVHESVHKRVPEHQSVSVYKQAFK